MANFRHVQFFRNNPILGPYNSLQEAMAGVKTTLNDNKSTLKDGEFILGRYSFTENNTTKYGVVVGIVREANGNKYLDFLLDENFINDSIASITSDNALLTVEDNGTTFKFGTQITQTNGINTVIGTQTIKFKTAPTDNNKILTEADLGAIAGAMYYKGTVDNVNTFLPTTATTPDVQPGWVYVVAADGTYAGVDCEIGDMIIVKTVSTDPAGIEFDIVSGENQYELGSTTVSVNGGSFTIGTFEGNPLNIEVTDDYSGLSGVVDASSVSTSLNTTDAQVDVLSAVEQIDGVLTTGTKVTLATVAVSGNASDVAIADSGSIFVSTNVEGALVELANAIESSNPLDVVGGEGIVVSSDDVVAGVTIATVAVDLAEYAHEYNGSSYNTISTNILLIGSDGKLTIEDTWDCGTY